MRTNYTREILSAAQSHGLSPDLVEALVLVESSGRAEAFRYEPGIMAQIQSGKLKPKFMPPNRTDRRVASSYGLMQLLFVTACDYGFRNEPEMLFVPWINLEYGCAFLGALLDWADGDYTRAFAAYNGGKAGNVTPPFRNQSYALRVFAAKDELLKT